MVDESRRERKSDYLNCMEHNDDALSWNLVTIRHCLTYLRTILGVTVPMMNGHRTRESMLYGLNVSCTRPLSTFKQSSKKALLKFPEKLKLTKDKSVDKQEDIVDGKDQDKVQDAVDQCLITVSNQ